jgi:heme transport system substrate-binding protein
MLKPLRAGMIFMAVCFMQTAYADAPKPRLISIDGSITEIIYALEAEASLVGVDTTSVFPSQALDLPNVGYMRALSSEGVLSLAPEIIITTPEAGPKKVLNNLKQAGLNVVTVDSKRSVEGVINKISQVAKALGEQKAGETLARQISTAAYRIASQIKAQQQTPKIMFLLAAGRHGVMVSGKNTQADAMITLLGGKNVVTEFSSYKPLTAEGLIAQNPEVIIVANNSQIPFNPESFPAIKLTKAFETNRIFSEDSMLVLGFGPRIVEAIESLATKIYNLNNTLAAK